MPDLRRVGDLEIDDDPRFQKWEWRLERVAWAGMAAFVLAALLGLLGEGPVSRRTADSPDGRLHVEYDRFLNHGSTTTLTVTVSGEVTAGGRVRLAVGRAYLDRNRVVRVTPEPAWSAAGADRAEFEFPAADPGRPAVITFHLDPQGAGGRRAELAAGGSAVAFDQFVYP